MISSVVNIAKSYNQDLILDMLNILYPENLKRYTVKIAKNNSNPSNRIEYIHNARGMTPAHMNFDSGIFDYGDWEDIWFIKENYPVMLKSNGTVDYRLDPNDYTKKKDGSPSDIANLDYNGNAMSRFPKVYLSFTEDAGYEYISVCKGRYDETYEPIGFINNYGREVDEIFLAIYRGYQDSNNKLRSLSDQYPTGNNTIANETLYATNNGVGWYTRTWAQRQMVNALLTIISKSDDSQTVFGCGVVMYDPFDESEHDHMSISGTLNDKGQFYGYNDQTHQVKVFHIEDWWGNQLERIAGLIVDSGNIKVAMKGPYDVNGSGSNYKIALTFSSDIGRGYTANCKCDNACGRLPISKTSPGGTSGSTSTFLCDKIYIKYGTSYKYYPRVGGANYDGLEAGLYFLICTSNVSYTYYDTGASLSYMSQF